jgi:hypothetical protein
VAREPQQHQRGGISITTLVIASVASAAAAYIVSRVWGAGTLFGAAATPIIVALVSEALRRPVEKLPPISVVRARTDGPAATMPDEPAIILPSEVPESFEAPRRIYSTTNRHHWRLALITGLVAFAIVAVVYTITDLAAGTPVTGSGRSSSLFDFSRPTRHRSTTTTTTTTTSTTPTQTQRTTTVTVPATTPPPTVTVTTPAPGTATPPAQTTPPTQATPPADAQGTPGAAPPPATTTPPGQAATP